MKKVTWFCVFALSSMMFFTAGCGGSAKEKGAATETPEMDPDQKKAMEQAMKGGAPGKPSKN